MLRFIVDFLQIWIKWCIVVLGRLYDEAPVDLFQQVASLKVFPSICLLQRDRVDIGELRSSAEEANMRAYHLFGQTIATKDDFFREAVKTFAFPTANISGWDAFLDYVRGIPWEHLQEEGYTGIFIIYSEFETFAKNDPASFSLVCAHFEQMQEEQWQYAQIPCYFVLYGSSKYVPPDVTVEVIR